MLLAGLGLAAVAAPAAQAAPTPVFGVEKFIAANCSAEHETCGQEGVEPFTKKNPRNRQKPKLKRWATRQAAGASSRFGITDFKINTIGEYPKRGTDRRRHAHSHRCRPRRAAEPRGRGTVLIRGIRRKPEAIPGTGFYAEPGKKKNEKGEVESKEIGVNKVIVTPIEVAPKIFQDVPIKGTAYNLVQPYGLASDFGVALELPEVSHQRRGLKRRSRNTRFPNPSSKGQPKAIKKRKKRSPRKTQKTRGRRILRPHPDRRQRGMGRQLPRLL